MKSLFEKYNISVDQQMLERFEKYYQLLVYYNEKFNITAITEREEVFIKHFVDSLLFVNKLKCGKFIDIGSGGGFPALPISILRPDIDYTLLEATLKKCEFLKTVISELNIKNAKVINGRAEDLAKDNLFREKFDGVTARAVARFNVLAEYCIPFIKLGGSFYAYKGDVDEELTEGLSAIKTLGAKLIGVEKIEFFDAKRSLVICEKIASTNEKYPRSNGKIKKSPL